MVFTEHLSSVFQQKCSFDASRRCRVEDLVTVSQEFTDELDVSMLFLLYPRAEPRDGRLLLRIQKALLARLL